LCYFPPIHHQFLHVDDKGVMCFGQPIQRQIVGGIDQSSIIQGQKDNFAPSLGVVALRAPICDCCRPLLISKLACF
jgi:hypothetical protein